MADEELVTLNGVNATTGDYLLPPLTTGDLFAVAQGERLDAERLAELRNRHHLVAEQHLGVKAGVDPTKLEEAGWGVIFAHDADPGIRAALRPLLEHRQRQAARRCAHYYREFTGADGYRPGESKNSFLARHRIGPGPANPDRVPYYLLIVGDPETIPYTFQYELDVMYAVGRIHFDAATADERYARYAAYAASVVAAETAESVNPPRASFFGVRNAGDAATQKSADHLVRPLAERVAADNAGCTVTTVLAEEATKDRLRRLLGGDDTPSLLFTAGHGVGFDSGDARQFSAQGALLCQDWPGPLRWGRAPIPERFYFSAADVGADARLHGLIVFLFACYGVGTPREDVFAHRDPTAETRSAIAPRAFVAALPQALLAHPAGGALAVIGHVERAWSYSFLWERAGEQLVTFESALAEILAGRPVGMAFEYFADRLADLSVQMENLRQDMRFGVTPDPAAFSGLWTANNDARGYAIFGDPAVRLGSAE